MLYPSNEITIIQLIKDRPSDISHADYSLGNARKVLKKGFVHYVPGLRRFFK